MTADELDKAKRQKVADFVYSQQSVESQASTLGSDFLSADDVDFSRQYTQRIQAVTAEQVLQAANKYLTMDAMAITRMVGAPAAATTAQATTAPVEAPGQKTVRFKLPNGLTVILGANDAVDLVAMNLAVLGGTLVENADTNGLGTLMTQLSLKGAGDRSAEQISDFFDRSGGSIGSQCGNNTFMWSATVLKDNAAEAAAILADVLVRPQFPQKELDILRPPLVDAINRTDEDWESQMQLFFRRQFFSGSPYRLLPLGSAGVVQRADRQAVADYHRKWVHAGSAVLAIYGNFDLLQMRAAVEKLFAEMPSGVNEVPVPAARVVKPGGERFILPTHNEVAGIQIGWPSIRINQQKDRTALDVLDTIISGYQLPRGWLHNRLRGETGGEPLVYVVHAYDWTGYAPGAFIVYAATEPPKAAQVVGIIRQIVGETLSHEFTPDEISEAVNIILTTELLDNQTMASLAMRAALDEVYGFGYDYSLKLEQRLRAVSPRDLHDVAQKYLAGPAVETITTPLPKDVATAAGQTVVVEPTSQPAATQAE